MPETPAESSSVIKPAGDVQPPAEEPAAPPPDSPVAERSAVRRARRRRAARRRPAWQRWVREFAVIAAGALAALAAQAWWQDRQDRDRERDYLRRLLADTARMPSASIG